MSLQLDNQAINENNNLTEPILPEGESTDNSIHQFETFEILTVNLYPISS